MFSRIQQNLRSKQVASIQREAELNLRQIPELWEMLSEYRRQSQSTGVSYYDYWMLYSSVKDLNPQEVLECGTGVSTLVLAYALYENEAATGKQGRLTSMEEVESWYEMSKSLLPEKLKRFVSFELSPRIDDHYYIFHGVRYRDLPNRPYEFIFVDGPNTESTIDGCPSFDMDLIHVLRSAGERTVTALIDNRLSTSWVMKQVLPAGKFRYDLYGRLGIIGPVRGDELLIMKPKKSFSKTFGGKRWIDLDLSFLPERNLDQGDRND